MNYSIPDTTVFLLRKVNLIIIVLLSFLLSCGTIRSRGNIAAIDSIPRGVLVKDANNKIIGTTPFFYKVPKSRKHFLFFNGEKHVYRCSVNWQGSLIPNSIFLPVYPVGTVYSLTLNLIDMFSGEYVSCGGGGYIARAKKIQHFEKTSIKSRRILILPPHSSDEVKSDKIVESFLLNLPRKERVNYVSPVKSKKMFSLYGIDFRENSIIEKIEKVNLYKIAFKYKVTHFLSLDSEEFKTTSSKIKFKITPIVRDAFTLKKVQTMPAYIKSLPRDDLFKRSVSDFINLIPNSITFGYKYLPSIDYESRNSSLLDSDKNTFKHPNALPALLRGLSIETAHHSMLFKSWDSMLFISPSFLTSAWRSKITDNYTIDIQAYSALLNAGVLLQSPFGQYSLSIGYGPSFLISEDSFKNEHDKLSTCLSATLQYRHFFNKRYFLGIFSNYNKANTSILNSPGTSLEKWSESGVSIGYYIPEAKSIIRNIFR